MIIGRNAQSSHVLKSKAKHCETNEDLQKIGLGDAVERWQWYAEWDEDCVYPATFEREWRTQGDDAADAVVRFFNLGPGRDGLQALLDYIEDHPDPSTWDGAVKVFWDDVTRAPPEGVAAHDSKSPTWTPEAAMDRGSRRPAPTLAEGQAVFWRYSVEITTALLHFSLAAGFTSPRLVNVLKQTGYLTSKQKAVTWRRLLETLQFILDAMTDLQPVKSKGWRSAVRVRLLHAQARCRIMDGNGRGVYDREVDGVAINQEDLAATLGSFCVAPIWSLRRLGVGLTEQEELAYLACWRHIGYYMGIRPDILKRHFGRSLSAAEKFLASATFHLFATEDAPSGMAFEDTTTHTLLAAIASRPPSYTPLINHVDIAHRVLGPGLARRLALPAVHLSTHLRVSAGLLTTRLLLLFGRYYPRRAWDAERQRLMQTILCAITAWQLGDRRTRFVAKTEEEYDKPYDVTGDGEPPDVALGLPAHRSVVARWRWLMAEVTVVVASGVLALVGSAWLSYRMAT